MSKPYTDEDLSAQIAAELNWRLKEISDLKSTILRSDEKAQIVLLRALVAICYAHWEGYVRFASQKYLQHVALRKFQYKKLKRQFLDNLFIPRLGAFCVSRPNLGDRCKLLQDIEASIDKRFSFVNQDLINTQSNLNSDVFSDICLICDLDKTEFAEDFTFIDVFLLKRRNAIAHGESTSIALSDLDEIAERTIELMRKFGNALDNKAVLKSYLA